MRDYTLQVLSLTLLVLGALPLHCIGNPIAEHSMAEMAHASGTLSPAVLGSVSFQTSCKPRVKEEFNRAVALLHSFWLDEAERTFRAVTMRDPDCAMAQWGVAMSDFNQVNGGPTSAGVAAANRALAKADAAREKDAREAAYIHALHSFFDGYAEKDFQNYAERYADAMSQVAAAYPNDLEAQVFYSLALINSEPRDDVALANKKKAVAILNPLFRAHPNHPGIAHYIIHACDNPVMAQQGIEAAVRYAAIAPAAPHALHMPSHIFMRLGLWQDNIRSNLASKAASEDAAVHVGAEARLHAMEFLEYAYLQSGHYSEAAAIVAEAKTVKESDVDPRFPHYFSIAEALYPALFAIETQDWATAASLKLEGPNWFTQAQAMLAHAVAAVHLHDAEGGKAAAEALEASVAPYPKLQAGSSYATLPDEIRAWARFAQGDLKGAVTLLEPVADRQDKLGEGGIEVPAREMLADMLLLNGRFAESLHEYQGVLASDPNRFNALLGAGRAAESLSERDVAANYYRTLLANSAGADGSALVALRHAQMVVDEIASAPWNASCSGTAPSCGGVAQSVVPKSDEAIVSCARAAPRSITSALTCMDKTEAMRQLDEAGCFVGNAPEVVEVRNVWLARESLPASAAARDRTIQLFMAGCLVEAHSKTDPPDPAEISAVAFLRRALADPDPQIAGVAMISLAPVLTKDDVDAIVRLASTQSALVMPAVTALSLPCSAEAKSGVASIQSVYAGSAQDNEIRRLVEGNSGLCDDDGHASRAEFSGKVFLPLPAPRGNAH
jgi:hypothetical protein